MLDYQGKKFHAFLKREIEKAKKGENSKVDSMIKAVEMLKVGKATVYQYFNTEQLSRKTVTKILTTFNVSEWDIWGEGDSAAYDSSHSDEMKQKLENLIQEYINTGKIIRRADGTLSMSPEALIEMQEKANVYGEAAVMYLNDNTVNQSNAKEIGQIEDQEDRDGNTKFTEISPGRYRMKVDLVPNFAKAGYLAGFEDPTHVEEFPKHEVTVTKYHKGKYMAFEVEGDSMDNGSIASVPDGCTITGRDIKRDLWESRLHVHKYPYWIFVHRTEGILVKMIKHQDLETGDIILESLNPDKDKFADIPINLNDVYKIFNVVKRELD